MAQPFELGARSKSDGLLQGGPALCVQIQPDKQAGGARQVADEPAHWAGGFPDERQGREDLAVAGDDGLLVDVITSR